MPLFVSRGTAFSKGITSALILCSIIAVYPAGISNCFSYLTVVLSANGIPGKPIFGCTAVVSNRYRYVKKQNNTDHSQNRRHINHSSLRVFTYIWGEGTAGAWASILLLSYISTNASFGSLSRHMYHLSP